MAVPNIISGNLTASISDHLPQFLVVLILFSILPISNPINMKKIDQNLTKKVLLWIIFRLIGISFCLHQTRALINHTKVSLKSLNLCSTFMYI